MKFTNVPSAAIEAAVQAFKAEHGVAPITEATGIGYSDECVHVWHPDTFEQEDGLPWCSIELDGTTSRPN